MLRALPKQPVPRRGVTLTIRVHRALRMAAAKDGVFIGDLADELIEQGLYERRKTDSKRAQG